MSCQILLNIKKTQYVTIISPNHCDPWWSLIACKISNTSCPCLTDLSCVLLTTASWQHSAEAKMETIPKFGTVKRRQDGETREGGEPETGLVEVYRKLTASLSWHQVNSYFLLTWLNRYVKINSMRNSHIRPKVWILCCLMKHGGTSAVQAICVMLQWSSQASKSGLFSSPATLFNSTEHWTASDIHQYTAKRVQA